MDVPMEPIVEAAWQAFTLVFSWPNILYPLVGTLLAMSFAFLPGVSGVTLMALAIPFTFGWEPLPVALLFGSLLGGATFMGSMTAILFNIPGTAPNAATTLDGYPMAQQGKAKTAAACSATASALGSTVGILLIILLIPVMRRAVLALGPAEILILVLWGLTTIVYVSRGSMVKGLASAGLGFLMALVGFDARTAELRYTFGTSYLADGLNLVPVFLGIFAIAEMIELSVSGRTTISGKIKAAELMGDTGEGIRSVFRNFGLFLRSSLIGTAIGMIPGVGGTVAGFAAYGHASQTAKKGRENFGRGDIRGVLAPEAANDAKDGGALLPTLALGIPGSAGTAMLLAALTLHGLVPGKEMMTTHLHLVFVLVWSLFFSNWMTSIIGLLTTGAMARLTIIRTHRMVPIVIVLASVGAFANQGRIEDVAAAFLFGILGYYMKKHGWSRIPMVTALILGGLFETNLHITMRLHELGRINFWTRPVAMLFLGLTVMSLVLPLLRRRHSENQEQGP